MPRSRTSAGFTLIEVLVISPIVILFIGAFVALAIGLTGESLQMREQNDMIYDVQASLNDIEANAARATQFLQTTTGLQVKQGVNDLATNFTTSTPALIFTSVATDKNPFDSTRSIVYTGSGSCVSSNPVYTYTTIYFIDSNASDKPLYKRQVLSGSTPCTTPFQKGTCSAATMASTPPAYCQATDDLLMTNLTGLTMTFYQNGTATADPTVANSVKVTLTSTQTIGGKSLTYTSDLQVTAANFGSGS